MIPNIIINLVYTFFLKQLLFILQNQNTSEQKELEKEIERLRHEVEKQQIKSMPESDVSASDIRQQLRSKSLELEETKLTLTETVARLKRVEANLKNQIIELKSKLSEKESVIQQLTGELNDCTDVKDTTMQEQLGSLKNILSLKDQEIEELHQKLELSNIKSESDQNRTDDVVAKFKECLKQLEKCEKQKLDSLQAFQTSECEHKQIVQSYRTKIKEQNEKLRKMDRKLKNMEAYAHEQIDNLQETMEKEHDSAMERMKSKMVEMKKSHVRSLDTLKRQHVAEVDELKRRFVEKKTVTTPTQVVYRYQFFQNTMEFKIKCINRIPEKNIKVTKR